MLAKIFIISIDAIFGPTVYLNLFWVGSRYSIIISCYRVSFRSIYTQNYCELFKVLLLTVFMVAKQEL